MEEEEEDEMSGWNRVEIDETPVNLAVGLGCIKSNFQKIVS